MLNFLDFLVYYDFSKEFVFFCDVLFYGFGVVFFYIIDGKEKLILYVLRILLLVEWNYV